MHLAESFCALTGFAASASLIVRRYRTNASAEIVSEISDSSDICDCEKAVHLVADCESLDAFREKCSLRTLDELKDMTDYYYRAHWAVVENRLRPETEIGDLNEEVVMERRRGLDWLFAPEDDWFDISLDT